MVWDGQLGSLLFSETPGGSLDKPCAVPHTAAMAETIKKGVKMCSVWDGLSFSLNIFKGIKYIQCSIRPFSNKIFQSQSFGEVSET